MYMHAKFGGHMSYGNGDINSYVNCYMNISEKAERPSSIHHIERFSKSRIAIYKFRSPGQSCWKVTKSQLKWQLKRLRSKTANRIGENQNHKTTCLNDHVTLWLGVTHPNSPRKNQISKFSGLAQLCLVSLHFAKYSVQCCRSARL